MCLNHSMLIIGTTRFNNTTWKENCSWRKKNRHSGCAYGVMKMVGLNIPLNSSIFVLEMNNSTNQIMGIGLVTNCPDPPENVRIYHDHNYCCYLYKGKYRIDRSACSNREKIILEIFEYLVFKNKTHLKRGQGITSLPFDMIKKVLDKGMDLNYEIKQMFLNRFQTAPSAAG